MTVAAKVTGFITFENEKVEQRKVAKKKKNRLHVLC